MPQSKYAELLAIIEELGKEIRPTYAGSKSAMERLKRGESPDSRRVLGTPKLWSSTTVKDFLRRSLEGGGGESPCASGAPVLFPSHSGCGGVGQG